MTGKEHVRAGAGVVSHAHFTPKAGDTFHPTAFDRRDKSWMRIKNPVPADLAAEPKLLTVSWQQQLDGRGVEADAVIERRHAVPLVDSPDHHHGDQYLHVGDQPGVAREQGLDLEWAIRFHDDIDPRGWDVHPRQLVHDFVDLHDDHAVVECCRLNDGRRVFGVRTRIEVAL